MNDLVIEDDVEGPYRYLLRVSWSDWTAPKGDTLLWCMLNPSLASWSHGLDPTARKVAFYTRREGYVRFEIVNAYALVSPEPKALRHHADPVGPRNDAAILDAVVRAQNVVVAWGAYVAGGIDPGRIARLLSLLPDDLWCLGVNGDGSPRHPLYLSNSEPLVPWRKP